MATDCVRTNQGGKTGIDSSTDAQRILELVREVGIQVTNRKRGAREQEARRKRLETAWRRFASFDGDAIPDEFTGDAFWRRKAELLVDLGNVLREDGWQAEIDAIAEGPMAKEFAVRILRLAMFGDVDEVARLMRESLYGDPMPTLCSNRRLSAADGRLASQRLMYEVQHDRSHGEELYRGYANRCIVSTHWRYLVSAIRKRENGNHGRICFSYIKALRKKTC